MTLVRYKLILTQNQSKYVLLTGSLISERISELSLNCSLVTFRLID